MKVTPVERSSSWHPVGSDARALAASRVQSVTSETAALPTPQPSVSGRELPVVAVKGGANVEARPVRQSDKAKGTDAALTLSTEFGIGAHASGQGTVTSTVDAFSTGARAAKQVGAPAAGRAPASTTHTAGPSQAKARAASAAEAVNTEEKQKAAQQRAAEAAAREPPKEPMSKVLLDVVQSMWAASRSVVDGANPKDHAGQTPKAGHSGVGTSVASPTAATGLHPTQGQTSQS